MALAEQKPETRLLQIFTVTIEPRQAKWLARRNADLKSAISSEIAGNCAEILKGQRLNEIEKTEGRHPNVLGSKIVSFTLNFDTVSNINSISTNGPLNYEETKLIIRYVLRQAYLAAHPSQPEVQEELSPPKTIFKDPSQIKTLEYRPWQPRPRPTPTAIASAKSTITAPQAGPTEKYFRWEPTLEDEAALVAYGTLTREQIIFARKWLKLSQEGLAEIVNVSRGIISDAENGRRQGEQTFRRISAGIWRHLKKQINSKAQENPIKELLKIFKERGI